MIGSARIHTSRVVRVLTLAALATAGVCAVSGCNILGPALILAQGPPTTDALVKLDKNRTHTIFIDDFRNRLPRRSLRFEMAETAEAIMIEQGVLPAENLLAAQAASRAASGELPDDRLSIADVGRKIGAEVVIYVTIDGWFLSRDAQSAQPAVLARVKIIDVNLNKRVWPPNPEGYVLAIQPKDMQGDLPTNLAGKAELERALADHFGLALAQMFFKHETRTSAKE